MIEYSICMTGIDDKTINSECGRLHNRVRELGGIFSTLALDDNLFFLIASNKNEDAIREEIICTIFASIKSLKAKFVCERLRYKTRNKLRFSALINALVNFDSQSDYKVVRYKFVFGKEINIYSFYMFKLYDLREKWSQLVDVTNQNSAFLGVDESYIDIIRFLVDGIKIGEEIRAVLEDKKVSIFDKEDNLLTEYNFDIDRFFGEMISHNPSRLSIKGFGNDINKFLVLIFEDRVQIY